MPIGTNHAAISTNEREMRMQDQMENIESSDPQLKVLGQYICNMAFKNPLAPASLFRADEKPVISVDVGVSTKAIEDHQHEVTIAVSATAKSASGVHYEMELAYAGLFYLTGFTQKQQHQVLFVNCPSMLFPFIRQIFGEMPRQGGFAPVWLDPIDWGGMYLQSVAELEPNHIAEVNEPARATSQSSTLTN
jgi:preprotein translocase subunit SecB